MKKRHTLLRTGKYLAYSKMATSRHCSIFLPSLFLVRTACSHILFFSKGTERATPPSSLSLMRKEYAMQHECRHRSPADIPPPRFTAVFPL